MHKFLTACGLCALALAIGLGAQTSDEPTWAYGVSATPPPRPAGPRPAPDTSPKHLPGTSKTMTLAEIRDYWNVGDWFPEEHPPMPNVVVHGRQPHVRGCAMCHMPSGKGRPENAPLAALPAGYFVQQMNDFKNGLRKSADPRKGNTAMMIEMAKDMTDAEMKEAATYFASLKWVPGWVTVREAATIPRMRLSAMVFFTEPGTDTEPLGNRIVETPEDAERFELRDPHSGFIAYVPPGSVAKGAALATSGGSGKTTACGICHGTDLQGLGPVPALAGRSPSYIMRQLWDFKQGARRGEWSPLMKPVVQNLSQEDMLDLSAFLAAAEKK